MIRARRLRIPGQLSRQAHNREFTRAVPFERKTGAHLGDDRQAEKRSAAENVQAPPGGATTNNGADAKMNRLIMTPIIGLLVATASAEPIDPSRIRVIDGDTIRVDRRLPYQRLGWLQSARNPSSKDSLRARARRPATARLGEITQASKLDYTKVPCSCRLGTEGTMPCNFRRRRGALKANGVDVGEIPRKEGLAVRSLCGPTSYPKTPTPWR